MQVIYTQKSLPDEASASIFLAGPTPRDADTPSWRPRALELLRERGFDGTVYVPEFEEGPFKGDYDAQVAWEEQALSRADVIVFWVPRTLDRMPAMTTNDEWGHWKSSGRVVFGAPPDAAKIAYQQWWAKWLGVPTAGTLEATLEAALAHLGERSPRDMRVTKGECAVPLLVWRRPEFQRWYARTKAAGNRLDDARLLWVGRGGPKRAWVVFWALQVSVWVASEQRTKGNELILGRSDASSALLYSRGKSLRETRVLLVREYRSAGTAEDGFVHELPGGSSFEHSEPRTVAREELSEEAGYEVGEGSLVEHGSRPFAATFAVHHGHLFSIELSSEQMDALEKEAGTARGLQEHSERTYTEVRTVGDLLDKRDCDWSTLGMVLSVVCG